MKSITYTSICRLSRLFSIAPLAGAAAESVKLRRSSRVGFDCLHPHRFCIAGTNAALAVGSQSQFSLVLCLGLDVHFIRFDFPSQWRPQPERPPASCSGTSAKNPCICFPLTFVLNDWPIPTGAPILPGHRHNTEILRTQRLALGTTHHLFAIRIRRYEPEPTRGRPTTRPRSLSRCCVSLRKFH